MNKLGHLVFALIWLIVAYQFAPLGNFFLMCILVCCALIPDFDTLFRTHKGGKWWPNPKWHRWIVTHTFVWGVLGYYYTANYSPMNQSDYVIVGYFCIAYASHLFGDLTKGVKSSIVIVPKLLTMKKSIRLKGNLSTIWLIGSGLTLIVFGIHALMIANGL